MTRTKRWKSALQSARWRASTTSASCAACARSARRTTRASGGGAGRRRQQPAPGRDLAAHHGVLFLDELPEFDRGACWKCCASRSNPAAITISRAARQREFPARFQLVAAMNPCPCGYLGSGFRRCRCTPDQVQRYRERHLRAAARPHRPAGRGRAPGRGAVRRGRGSARGIERRGARARDRRARTPAAGARAPATAARGTGAGARGATCARGPVAAGRRDTQAGDCRRAPITACCAWRAASRTWRTRTRSPRRTWPRHWGTGSGKPPARRHEPPVAHPRYSPGAFGCEALVR